MEMRHFLPPKFVEDLIARREYVVRRKVNRKFASVDPREQLSTYAPDTLMRGDSADYYRFSIDNQRCSNRDNDVSHLGLKSSGSDHRQRVGGFLKDSLN